MISKKDQLIENILASDDALDLVDADLQQIFNNQDNIESMMSVIVKSNSGKKKTKVSKAEGNQLMDLAQGIHSDATFDVAFTRLSRGETVRRSAKKIGVSPAYVYNLRAGKTTPSIDLITSVAKAYKVHPCFFVEYRIHYILSHIKNYLDSHPETASSWFYKLKKGLPQ